MSPQKPDMGRVIAEDAHARAIGRPKDSCPYPAETAERRAWLDGYDGTPCEDVPIADA